MEKQLNTEKVRQLVKEALKEDIGNIDLTTTYTVPPGLDVEADIIVKDDGVIAGLSLVEILYNTLDANIRFKPLAKDGDDVHSGKTIAYVAGSAKSILTGERVALNFLCRLSGIATLTRKFVKKVEGYNVKIKDTRKTTPLLRDLEKYAVRAGGGYNHRMGLNDQVLIKDNHLRCEKIAMVKNKVKGKSEIGLAIHNVKKSAQENTVIEVEVENLAQLKEALKSGPDIILLDNMTPNDVAQAVKVRDLSDSKKRIALEVSGGVNLENVKEYAAAGVEMISIGALTHSAPALNISLEVVK